MLGKLIKYEFKATYRLFLLMYGILVMEAVINMVITPGGDTATGLSDSFTMGDTINTAHTVIAQIMTIMYVLSIIAVLIITQVVIILRFYKNLLGDEGYLMFTLPVTPTMHIWSKLIAAAVWNVATIIAVGASIVIILAKYDLITAIRDIVSMLSSFGIDAWLWVIVYIVIFFIGIISGILQFYTAMAIGPYITKSRLGGSILGYVIVYFAGQIASSVVTLLSIIVLGAVSGDGTNVLFGVADISDSFMTMNLWLIFMLLGSFVVIGVPCFILTRVFLTKKLNLG